MKTIRESFALTIALIASLSTQAQVSVGPLATFGNVASPGWLQPTNGYSYLTTGNTERGLAYGNGHLYLVARGASSIRILNSQSGADLGSLLTTGISGGTYAMNMVGVGRDGAIYVNNLTIQASDPTRPYKVYRWTDELATPTVAYSGTPILGGRVGDTFDVFGGGSMTLLASGFGNSPATNGNNGYAIIDPNTGTSSQIVFTGTPPLAGDFRLGLTFTDASHVMGTPGNTNRYTSFSGTSGTLEGSFTWTTGSQRAMDYAIVNGMPLLAAMDTGDSKIRLYDATDPLHLAYLTTATTLTLASVPNINGVGSVAWGDIYPNPDGTATAELFALNCNNGIQAFIVTVPEPSIAGLALVGGLLITAWTTRRRSV